MDERPPEGARTLTERQLAGETGTTVGDVRRYVAIGAIAPIGEDRHGPGDIARVKTLRAIEVEGVDLVRHADAVADLMGGFIFLGRYFADPGPLSRRTFAEFIAELGPVGSSIPAIYAAFGLPVPAADSRLPLAEERITRVFAETWDLVAPDATGVKVRAARSTGEPVRRLVTSWLDLFDEHVFAEREGRPASFAEAMQGGGGGEASARLAGIYPELLLWLHQRHLEQILNARIISAVELRLQERGYVTPGPRRLPAVAFVDLSGYTRLTEAAGDEAAARSAARLQELADAAARRGGGRLVKLLGDGALLYFEDTDRAVGTTLELLDEIDRSELPAAHAGMQAGSVVLRDGDVYGRTVNLAARIVGAAAEGELVVGPGVLTEWTGTGIAFVSRGEVELKGIAAPVPLYVARPE
jgi:adenylate cyclase